MAVGATNPLAVAIYMVFWECFGIYCHNLEFLVAIHQLMKQVNFQ